MQCKSQDKQKAPCEHPSDHLRLRRSPLTALACNLTLPKLHLATLKFALKMATKSVVFYRLLFSKVCLKNFPESADFSVNLSLKILRNIRSPEYSLQSLCPQHLTFCGLWFAFSHEKPDAKGL